MAIKRHVNLLDNKAVNLDKMSSRQGTRPSNSAMSETKEKKETDAIGEGSSKNSEMPRVPFEVIPVHCPKDCLIVYPVQPRKSVFLSLHL